MEGKNQMRHTSQKDKSPDCSANDDYSTKELIGNGRPSFPSCTSSSSSSTKGHEQSIKPQQQNETNKDSGLKIY